MTETRQEKVLFKTTIKIISAFALDFVLNLIWSIAAVLLFVAYLSYRTGGMESQSAIYDAMNSSPAFLFLGSIYNVFVILMVYLFWRFWDGGNADSMGLRWKSGSLRLFWLGLAGGAFEMLLVIAVGMLSGILWYESSWELIYTRSEILRSILYGIPTFLLVGFGEEAIFRGYIQKKLMGIMNNGFALLAASVIFMAAHLLTYSKLFDFIDVFLGGIVMGYLFMLTGSLYISAGYHFLYDFIQVNIVKLQYYEWYNGAVMYQFGNSGDFVFRGSNLGSKVELCFIAAELLVMGMLYLLRNRIRGLRG